MPPVYSPLGSRVRRAGALLLVLSVVGTIGMYQFTWRPTNTVTWEMPFDVDYLLDVVMNSATTLTAATSTTTAGAITAAWMHPRSDPEFKSVNVMWDTKGLADTTGDAVIEGQEGDYKLPVQFNQATAAPEPDKSGGAGRIKTALGRALCIVVVMGKDVDLALAPTTMLQQHKNCLFHVLSNDSTVWPPPPPSSFYFHRYHLVSDSLDRVGPAAAAAPARTTFTPSSFDMKVLLPGRQSVRATAFFETLEHNRIASVVIRAREDEDVAALTDVLGRFVPSAIKGFLEVVVVQTCTGDSDKHAKLLDELLRQKHGYDVEADATAFVGADDGNCKHTVYTRPNNPTVYPQMPKRFMTLRPFGRYSNQLIEDANAMTDISHQDSDKPARERAYLAPESYLHQGAMTVLYNFSVIANKLGRPNMLLSQVDVATVNSAGYCGDKPVHNIYSLDSCISRNCVKDNCLLLDSLPLIGRTEANYSGPAPFDANNLDGQEHGINDEATGILFPGSVYFFMWPPWTHESFSQHKRPPTDATVEISNNVAWNGFSAFVDDLARLQYAIFEARLRAFWKLSPTEPVKIVGIHMRLDDYSFATKSVNWITAATEAKDHLKGVHGVIMCSDQVTSEIYLGVLAMMPDVPKFDCTPDLLFDQGNRGLLMPVTQQLLGYSTCFIGLRFSTFSWRIQARRVVDGHANPHCDKQLFTPGLYN